MPSLKLTPLIMSSQDEVSASAAQIVVFQPLRRQDGIRVVQLIPSKLAPSWHRPVEC